MEFDNVHEEVADLRMRVEKLEALFSEGKAQAQADMQKRQEDAQTQLRAAMDAQANAFQSATQVTEPEAPVAETETTDGEVSTSHDAQDGDVSGKE